MILMLGTVYGMPAASDAHTVSEEALEQFTLEEVHPDETTGREVADEGNRRSEGRTYFSFPEWYIVYSSQEYARFISKGGHPSNFPYIDAVEQFWQSVDGVRKATEGKYEINNETETVINTIGVSFTVEYWLTALYESTIGRVTKILNFSKKSPEDLYNEKVAVEYGEFLNQIPWYEFPYFKKLGGLWTEAYGWNSVWVRGIERRVFLSVNYLIKGTYGAVIKKLTQSSFDAAAVVTEYQLKGSTDIATSTRYRAFTKDAETFMENGAEFVTIEKNDTILVSVLAPEEKESCIEEKGHIVFHMPILTEPPLQRFVIVSPVASLHLLQKDLRECEVSFEHLYDY
jgi:hypothetical protein